MNTVAAVLVPLVEVLEAIGLDEDKIDDVLEVMDNFFESDEEASPDGSPEVCEGFGVYVEDEALLKSALKKSLKKHKGYEDKFHAVLEKISKEHNDLPVYVTI